jgi:hypothetical protein
MGECVYFIATYYIAEYIASKRRRKNCKKGLAYGKSQAVQIENLWNGRGGKPGEITGRTVQEIERIKDFIAVLIGVRPLRVCLFPAKGPKG